MVIPHSCSVLVIGGGPSGSAAAAALAREGIDVVVLEADKFPRYHIGESMIPAIRPFLQFIDCYETFNAHGFNRKNGGVFKFHSSEPESYTDFIAACGPDGYAWNVIRSEADELLFKHAGDCGAQVFDTTKVTTIQFEPSSDANEPSFSLNGSKAQNPGRPVSATWTRQDGTSGAISFGHLVDASGRYGILSTKYLKNRYFNQELKNVSSWGYWKGAGVFGMGTRMEGAPYFEALQDSSGWGWFIPLHNGTWSVGIVQTQVLAAAKKRALGSPSSKDYYLESLHCLNTISQLLSKAELVTDVKSASDWSYTATTYAFPYARICGDAGCFIDPLFSSGVHLAMMGGLSAAMTIAASLRGDCDEMTAASWHSKKTNESYNRFYVVVDGIMKQILSQDKPVIEPFHDDGFQSALDVLNPVIQGTIDADADNNLSPSQIPELTELLFKMARHDAKDQTENGAIIEKIKSLEASAGANGKSRATALEDLKKDLNPKELEILELLESSRAITENVFSIDWFTFKPIDGLVSNMKRGELGLVKVGS